MRFIAFCLIALGSLLIASPILIVGWAVIAGQTGGGGTDTYLIFSVGLPVLAYFAISALVAALGFWLLRKSREG